MSDSSVKTCDLCGRLVVKGQSQCACGSRVSFSSADSGARQPFDYGKLLPVIPALGLIAYLYIGFNPAIIRFSGMPLLKVMLVTFIASAAVALLISDRAHKENWLLADTRFSGFSPPNWFAAVLIAWPVSFPLFMKVHYERTNPRRLKMAQAAHLAFLFAFAWVFFYGHASEKPAATVKPEQSNSAPAPVHQTPAKPSPVSAPSAVSLPQTSPASTLPPQEPPQQIPTATPYVPPKGPPIHRSVPSRQNTNSPSSANSEPGYGVDILGKR